MAACHQILKNLYKIRIICIAKNVLFSEFHLCLAHADVVVVVDVVREVALLLEVGDGGLHHLVEDVVGPLHLLYTQRDVCRNRVL